MIVDVYTTDTTLKSTKITDISTNITVQDKTFKLEGIVLYKPLTRVTRGSKSESRENLVHLSAQICHYTAAVLYQNGQWIEIDDLCKGEKRLTSKMVVPHLLIYSEIAAQTAKVAL